MYFVGSDCWSCCKEFSNCAKEETWLLSEDEDGAVALELMALELTVLELTLLSPALCAAELRVCWT